MQTNEEALKEIARAIRTQTFIMLTVMCGCMITLAVIFRQALDIAERAIHLLSGAK